MTNKKLCWIKKILKNLSNFTTPFPNLVIDNFLNDNEIV